MEVKTYNRIESSKRKVGEIITRSGPAPLAKDFPEVEAILERRRPEDRLSRAESVNMCGDRDFSQMGIAFDQGYVHRLKPHGEDAIVEVRDVVWIGALQARHPKESIRKFHEELNRKLPEGYPGVDDDELADRYWQGILSDQPWIEYATKEAEVISVDEELSRVRPPSEMEKAWAQIQQRATNDNLQSEESD